jgi:hypothetical protein
VSVTGDIPLAVTERFWEIIQTIRLTQLLLGKKRREYNQITHQGLMEIHRQEKLPEDKSYTRHRYRRCYYTEEDIT